MSDLPVHGVVTGVDIVGTLLRADAAVTALVPVERIKGGRLPDDVPLPALLVRLVSSVDQQLLKRGEIVPTKDRVAVTVRAASYGEQGLIIRRVRAIAAGRVGDVAGASSVSIFTAGLGPDVEGPGDSFEQTQDFRVSFDAVV